MRKYIFTVLIVVWMSFIFSMSSQNSQISSNTSSETIRVILSLVPKFTEQSEEAQEDIVENLQFVVRKSAHFIAYMILGIIWILLLLQFSKIDKKTQLAFGLCIAYAISDEIHQLFVPGRSGELKDVLIDSAGSLTGIALVLLCIKMSNLRKSLNH